MHLYLVQHGLSRPKEEDPDRPLSEAGESQVNQMARFAAALGDMTVKRVLHSGKKRAEQTAAIMAATLHDTEIMATDGLRAKDDPKIWANRLNAETTDTMLVGHLPHLDRLAALLLAGDSDRSIVAFVNAGILALQRDPEKGWQVQWMATPDIIR